MPPQLVLVAAHRVQNQRTEHQTQIGCLQAGQFRLLVT